MDIDFFGVCGKLLFLVRSRELLLLLVLVLPFLLVLLRFLGSNDGILGEAKTLPEPPTTSSSSSSSSTGADKNDFKLLDILEWIF